MKELSWCSGRGGVVVSRARVRRLHQRVNFAAAVWLFLPGFSLTKHQLGVLDMRICVLCVCCVTLCVTTECEDVQNVQRATIKCAVFQGALQTLCR